VCSYREGRGTSQAPRRGGGRPAWPAPPGGPWPRAAGPWPARWPQPAGGRNWAPWPGGPAGGGGRPAATAPAAAGGGGAGRAPGVHQEGRRAWSMPHLPSASPQLSFAHQQLSDPFFFSSPFLISSFLLCLSKQLRLVPYTKLLSLSSLSFPLSLPTQFLLLLF